jgi:hypothetical protein
MKKVLLAILLSLIVVGCAGAPVGWGGSHEIILANQKSVTFRYDPILVRYTDMMADATKHCSSYKKDPVITITGNDGPLRTQTFECR